MLTRERRDELIVKLRKGYTSMPGQRYFLLTIGEALAEILRSLPISEEASE